MPRDIIPHELKDWSTLPTNENLWTQIDISTPGKNFDIHKYNDRLWTSGYVGVGRLYNRDQKPICTNGKEHIAIISSQYGMDPWKMLEVVMTDEEYESYLSELDNGEFIYRVFYDQPLIRLAQNSQNAGDLLYALSFVNSCYDLCKKGLKKSLYRKEANYQAKVRGRINIKKNIRENTCRGRNDRFHCEFIDFTEDTLENRIIKATFCKCKGILLQRFKVGTELRNRIVYCQNTLRHVKTVEIKSSDFNMISTSGLYMYYKPVLRQARCIHSQKYYSYVAENGETITKSVYTVPYMINMEKLFEFYTRTMLKKIINTEQYYIEQYSKKLFLQYGISSVDDVERGTHLMSYCIPDIVIYKRDTNEPFLVLDAKYKAHSRAVRADSHQLLAYVLLTGVKRCGFIFPGSSTSLKTMRSSDNYLRIADGSIRYYELIMGNNLSSEEIGEMFL